MSSSGLRIRDLSLPLTKHKRSLVDGSIIQEPQPTDDEIYFLNRRKFLVQCRFVTPIRGVSAVSVPTTDRTPILEIKMKLLEQLHDLPEPPRPPDSVLAVHGSRYFQRKTLLQNDFKVSIATDPEQLIFFLDDRDDALNDDVTLYDLGFETAPPLISVYCATDHMWLRLRGFPERFPIPWHLHMTECELAKEVYGLLKPRDMRVVRAVFYKDDEALKMHRKYRRPATEAPPTWKPGSHFGRFETEDSVLSSSFPNSSGNRDDNDDKRTRVLHPSVIPLHEWCQIPPPANTKIDPSLPVEEIRREAARVRSSLLKEAFAQARDSWFDVPPDMLSLAEVEGALEHIPRWIHFTRKRDGRNYCFKVELARLKRGGALFGERELPETAIPVGDLAEAVVEYCSTATNRTGVGETGTRSKTATTREQRGDGGDDDERSTTHHSTKRDDDSDDHDGENFKRSDGDDHSGNDDEFYLASKPSTGKTSSSYSADHTRTTSVLDTELLTWVPHLVATGNILADGKDERVPHSHPQLFLPFDDDDEEVSPFGRKEIHTLWNSNNNGSQVDKYPFLEPDFFFHKRRAKATAAQVEDLIKKEALAFLREPLMFSFNAPYRGTGTTRARHESENPAVEFDNASLPRHLSDYGIYNGAEVFVEYFSIHAQSWSNDIAKQVHEAMKERMRNLVLATTMTTTTTKAKQQNSTSDGPMLSNLPKFSGGNRNSAMFATASKNLELITTSFDRMTHRGEYAEFSSQNANDDDDDYDEEQRQKQSTKPRTSTSPTRHGGGAAVSSIQFSAVDVPSSHSQNNKNNNIYNSNKNNNKDNIHNSNTNCNDNSVTRNLLDDERIQRQHLRQLRQRKAMQLQLSVRQREATVRAAGFHFINVRSARGTLFRVPVMYEVAIIQDVLELIFCATGDIPMFSIVVGPQGALLAPWTPLTDVEKNPGLLTLRILRRPRAWMDETVETVARDASRLAPHLD